jgi:dolichol-phosphate mannosyltransferase
MMSDNLYIVIPAYNEEENIDSVAREWHEVVLNIGKDSRLVIIDDGSKDSSYKKLCELSEKLPQLVPITKPNGGHGSTVLYGYNYALEMKADYIFQTDSDGQTLPSEFKQFWEKRNDYAAIIGHRNHREDGFSRVFVTKTLKFVLWSIFHLNITDANTPFRLMKRETLQKYIKQIPKDFNLSNVMLTVLLLNAKEKVKFIPITFRPRQGGVNSINLPRIFKIGKQAVKDFRQIKKAMS